MKPILAHLMKCERFVRTVDDIILSRWLLKEYRHRVDPLFPLWWIQWDTTIEFGAKCQWRLGTSLVPLNSLPSAPIAPLFNLQSLLKNKCDCAFFGFCDWEDCHFKFVSDTATKFIVKSRICFLAWFPIHINIILFKFLWKMRKIMVESKFILL